MQAVMNILVNVNGAKRAQAQLAGVSAATRAAQTSSGRAAQAMSRFSSGVGAIGTGMERFGKNMQWVGRQIEFNFTLPILLATGLSAKWALEVEASMTRLRKVYGDTSMSTQQMTEETEALGRAFRFLSDQYGVALDEVVEAGAAYAQAGAENIAVANGVRASVELSILGEMELAEATEALIAIQAQYNVESKEMRQVIADLNIIENETTVSMQDLTAAMQRGAGIAREAGVPWNEFGGMVAAIVPAAGNATQAGNSLKTIITRVMAPAKEGADAFARLGININDVAWQSMTGTERLMELARALEGTGTAERNRAMDAIFGQRQIARGAVLMRDMTNEQGRYQRAIDVTADSQQAMNTYNKELDIFMRSSPQMLKIMTNQMKNYAIEIGQQLLPTLLAVVAVVRDWAQRFAELDPQVRNTVVAVALLVAVTGPLIRYMGAFILLSSQIVKGFHGIAIAAAWLAAPFAKVGGAIIGIPKAIAKWWAADKFLKIIGSVTGPLKKLSGFLVAWVGLHAPMFAKLAAVILGPWGLAVGGIAIAMALFQDHIGAAVRWAHNAFGSLPRGIANAMNNVVRVVRSAAIAVRNWIARMLNPFGGSRQPQTVPPPAQILQGGRAAGGPVDKGSTYLVGEKGPELFTAKRGGAIVDADTTQAMQAAKAAKTLKIDGARAAGGPTTAGSTYLVGENGPELFSSNTGGSISNLDQAGGAVDAASAKLDKLRDSAKSASDALRGAEQRLTELGNTPIKGIGAANDAIFANEQAQKRVRLEIAKLGPAVAAHDKRVKASAATIEAANARLETLRQRASDAGEALQAAQAKLDAFANTPITGMRAAEDAIFANEMAQKRLQLQIARLEQASAGWRAELDRANAALDASGDRLDALRDRAQAAKDALEGSQSELERLSSMPIQGMRAMNDAIWENEMAQKQLRLEILKLKDAEGPVEDLTNKLARLQGDIERMGGKREDLRLAGAGSDILGTYDAQIDQAKQAQKEIMAGGGQSAAAQEMEQLEAGLEQLRLEAEMMELEKSLKFDPLTRQIERLTDGYQEMPFSAIVSGIQAQQQEVARLTQEYNAAEAAVTAYNVQVERMQADVDRLEASGPAKKMAELEESLNRLRLAGEIMDLEKSLKFDPLNRQIEKLTNTQKEMPFSQIAAGIKSQQGEVARLTKAHEAAESAVDRYSKQVDNMEAAHARLEAGGPTQKVEALTNQLGRLQNQGEIMDLEKSLKFDPLQRQLDKLQDTTEEMTFSEIATGIKAQQGEVARLTDAYENIEGAVQAQEAVVDQLREVESAYKDIEAAQSSAAAASAAAGDMPDAGLTGDFEIPGGMEGLTREEGDIDDLIAQWANEDLFKGLIPEFDMFKPFRDKWNEFTTWATEKWNGFKSWLKSNGIDLDALFSRENLNNIWEGIKTAWGNVKAVFTDGALSQAWDQIRESANNLWTALKEGWERFKGPFIETWNIFRDGILRIWERLKTEWNILWDSLGGEGGSFNKFFNGIVGFVTTSVDNTIAIFSALWQGLMGAWSAVLPALNVLWTAITEIIEAAIRIVRGIFQAWMGLFTGDWSAMVEGIKAVWSGLWAIVAAITKGAIDLVVALFGTLWSGIKMAWDRIFETIKRVAVAIWDWLVGNSLIPDLVNAILGWFQKLVDLGRGIWEAVKAVAVVVWTAIKDTIIAIVTGFINGVKTVIGGVAEFLSGVWNGIKTVAANAWGAVRDTVGGAVTAARDKVVAIATYISGWLQSRWNYIKEYTKLLWFEFRYNIENAITQARAKVVEIATALSTWLSDRWTSIRNTAQNLWNSLRDRVRDAINSANTTVRNIVANLLTWLATRWTSIRNTAQNLWNSLRDRVRDAINSVNTTVRNIVANLLTWLATRWTSIRTTAQNLWNSLRDRVRDAINSTNTAVRNVVSGLLTWLSGRWTSIRNTASNLWTSLKNTVRDQIEGMRQRVVTVVNGLRDWLSGRWAAIRTRAQNVFSAMMDTVGSIWNRIKNLVRKPIHAAVSVAINPIISGINRIRKLVGQSSLPGISIPKFHKGGVVGDGYGVGSPDTHDLSKPIASDEQLALLRNGERVLTKKQREMYEGSPVEKETGDGIGAALIGSIKKMAFSAADKLRSLASKTVRPLFNAAMKAVNGIAGGKTGFGDMIIKLAKKGGNAAIDWLGGVEKAAPKAPPLDSLGGKTGPGDSGLWRSMWAAVRGQFGTRARLASGYRPGAITATGRRSYHGMGRAVDLVGKAYMNKKAMKEINHWIYANYKNKSRELIYSGPNAKEVLNGKDYNFTGITRSNHFDHVHWAMDKGGFLEAGMNPPIYNGLGTREIVTPEKLMRRIVREEVRADSYGSTTVNFYGDLSFPNVKNENDAEAFIRNLESMVG